MMDTETILSNADAMFKKGEISEAGKFLENAANEALMQKKLAKALSVLNELTGYYRNTDQMDKAWQTVDQMIEILDQLNLWDSLDATTVVLNIATVYKASGKLETAEGLYHVVEKVFQDAGVMDARLGGLYNNICVVSLEQEKYQEALTYGRRAALTMEGVAEYEDKYQVVLKNVKTAEEKLKGNNE